MVSLPGLLDTELGYIVLLFALFVVPRIFQRWHLPTAITSLGLGMLAGMGLGVSLIMYTLLNTVVPGLLLRTPAPTFDAPELPEVEPPPKE